jgi:NhaP-type Na+/H+ or K+/H+ antiporter
MSLLLFLLLGIPLPLYLLWNADTPENFWRIIAITGLSTIPLAIAWSMLYDWVKIVIFKKEYE